MLVREFEGKTEKDAIKLALETLNLEENQVRIESVDDGKVGFFSFRSKKPVKINVYYEEQQNSSFAGKAKQYLLGLFDAMGLKADVVIEDEDDEKLYLEIVSESSGLLIGKRGKNLEALQFMLNVTMNREKNGRDQWKKIVLDIEGYWDKREETIKRLALKAANAVRTTQKSKILEAMNPFERRLVHLTLQNYHDIGTRSLGDGIYKKVRVFLK